MLEGLTRLQLDGAVLVLALGPRMRNRVARYATSDTRLEWVSLWGTPPEDTVDMAAPALWRVRRGWAPAECVLLYSGNMGLGHRVSEFLLAADQLGEGGRRRVGDDHRAHPSA